MQKTDFIFSKWSYCKLLILAPAKIKAQPVLGPILTLTFEIKLVAWGLIPYYRVLDESCENLHPCQPVIYESSSYLTLVLAQDFFSSHVLVEGL